MAGEKRRGYRERRMAMRQLCRNLPLWLCGAVSSMLLIGAAVCVGLREEPFDCVLIAVCAAIGIFLIVKRTAGLSPVYHKILRTAGVSKRQILKIGVYQVIWMLFASVPTGILLGITAGYLVWR